MTSLRQVLTVVLAAATWLHPADATACSPLPPVSSRFVVPHQGSLAVPTNARLLLRLEGASASDVAVSLSLRIANGAELPLAIESVSAGDQRRLLIATPATPLEPQTTYEVYDSTVVPCFDWSSCVGAPQLISIFTTAEGPDTTPPAFGFGAVIDGPYYERCDNQGCCGPYDVVSAVMHFGPASDEASLPLYDVYLNGETEPAARMVGPDLSVKRLCAGNYFVSGFASVFVGLPATVMLRAYDYAGNSSDSYSVQVNVHCPDSWPQDGGGSADAGGDAADADGGGCGCRAASQRGHSPAPTVVLAWLLTALRRRKSQ